MYGARGYVTAEVFAIRGQYAIGYVTLPGETKKAVVWNVADGTKVGGPHDENLFVFLGPAKPRIKKPKSKQYPVMSPSVNPEKTPWTC
jgi:hypothetical protein